MSESAHLRDVLSLGCEPCSLGIQKMPDGYSLLRDRDGYFFWLENDTGATSVICWDRWQVWRWAQAAARERGAA